MSDFESKADFASLNFYEFTPQSFAAASRLGKRRRQSARHAGLRGGALALALDDGERARFVCS